jgi:hypothetical protein
LLPQSEYPPDCDARRAYISGFDGSAGTVVVCENEALLWTDGRYFLQVCRVAGFQVMQLWWAGGAALMGAGFCTPFWAVRLIHRPSRRVPEPLFQVVGQ